MQRGTKLCASFDSDYGADVDSVDTDVRIPSAPRSPALFCVLVLLLRALTCFCTHGGAAGVQGSTALHCAALGGHRKVVKLLLHYGASLRLRDGVGRTALELATEAGTVRSAVQ